MMSYFIGVLAFVLININSFAQTATYPSSFTVEQDGSGDNWVTAFD
jgi:hypothetical protein